MPVTPQAGDSILDEWFPVVALDQVAPGTLHRFELLGDRYVLLGAADGTVSVLPDTCPHRGAQLSLGTFDGVELSCGYHGWRFGADGTCRQRPAHPDQPVPSACSLAPLALVAAYGLWWVCVGSAPRRVPRFDAYQQRPGRTVTVGPKVLEACGPRIVENFLDVAHFPYVHAGYLGQVPHTEVADYLVEVVDDELVARDIRFWQPVPGPRARVGGEVGYVYGVSHPYAARLTKVPAPGDGGAFSLLIVAAPETETRCRVWLLTTVVDLDEDLASYQSFNEIIFDQDVKVVESQRPRRLPLDPRAEVHQRADKMSLAYRRWLVARGTRYGTETATAGPTG